MTWMVGGRVRHTVRPEWGQGSIRAVGPADRLTVYFANVGEMLLTPRFLVEVTGAEAEKPFFMPRAGKRKSAAPRGNIADYKKVFLEQFPRGFRDPAFLDQERTYKLEARDLLVTSLSAKEFRALEKSGEHAAVCKLARAVISKTNLVFSHEQMKLSNGLKGAEAQPRFSASLYLLLHGNTPFEERFTGFADALSEIGAAKWTIATYFPFLMMPEEHLFLKPNIAKLMADVCRVELNYRPEPNWLTYQCLLRLAAQLFEDLEDLKPKDMIDVQSFMWCVAR
ncbi:MAG: DUF3553 domain-containing protein [Vicinamibacteria bacterium]|nr:DUF3553 domain-containing protein [Vicinamibacteria bacterium]